MRLNHVALTVLDREVSAKFYEKWFAMKNRIHEDDHLLILTNENGDLLALSNGDPDIPVKRTTHFGFQIDDPEDVRKFRMQALDAGVKEAEWQVTATTRCQLYDPDGYRVEIYAFDW